MPNRPQPDHLLGTEASAQLDPQLGPGTSESSPAKAPKLHLLFASEAPKAVVLRRGPSKAWSCILWDLDSDTFTEGSWFYGQLRPDQADLSPTGEYLIYQAADYRETKGLGHFTAICKPPNLQPRQLWLNETPWIGGGRFLDARRFARFYGPGRQPEPQLDPLQDLQDATDRSDSDFDRLAAIQVLRTNRQTQLASQYSTLGYQLHRGPNPSAVSLIHDFADMAFNPNRAPFHEGDLRAKVNESLRGEW